MNILIVDDQSIHLDLLSALLAQWPEHHVLAASGGRQALEVLRTHGHRLDAVFLDLVMPEVGGMDVLNWIQESPLHRKLRVVVCSGRQDRETVTAAVQRGASHYLFKPCTEAAVAQKLRQIAVPAGAD